MKRFVGLSLAAGVLFTCMAGSSSQSAPVSGAIANPAAQSSGIRQPSVLAAPLSSSLRVAPWSSPLLVMRSTKS